MYNRLSTVLEVAALVDFPAFFGENLIKVMRNHKSSKDLTHFNLFVAEMKIARYQKRQDYLVVSTRIF